MDKITVEITSCSVPTAWYAKLIGHKFEVYNFVKDYVLCEDYDAGDQAWWRHISKDECKVVSDEPKRYVVCDECPCRNNDYEQPSECNLGYEMGYVKVDLSDDPKTKFLYLSPNCELIAVKVKDGSFKPSVFTGKLLEERENWEILAKENHKLCSCYKLGMQAVIDPDCPRHGSQEGT